VSWQHQSRHNVNGQTLQTNSPRATGDVTRNVQPPHNHRTSATYLIWRQGVTKVHYFTYIKNTIVKRTSRHVTVIFVHSGDIALFLWVSTSSLHYYTLYTLFKPTRLVYRANMTPNDAHLGGVVILTIKRRNGIRNRRVNDVAEERRRNHRSYQVVMYNSRSIASQPVRIVTKEITRGAY